MPPQIDFSKSSIQPTCSHTLTKRVRKAAVLARVSVRMPSTRTPSRLSGFWTIVLGGAPREAALFFGVEGAKRGLHVALGADDT